MRFGWTDEQKQLRDMLQRFATERHDFDRRRERLASNDGAAIWAELAELGLMALPLPEEAGGIAGSMLDLVIVAEALGRGLLVEPYAPTIVLGAGILTRANLGDRREAMIEAVAAGERKLAFAYGEPRMRYAPERCTLATSRDGADWILNGKKAMVLGGDQADILIVLAREAGEPGDEDGLALFLVDADAIGLSTRRFNCIDGTGAAELLLENVRVASTDRIDDGSNALRLTRSVLNDAAVFACAEMCGAAASLNEKTLAYLQQRKAFGQEIVMFQSVQHRLVDMKVSEEQCVAITLKAAQALAEGHSGAAQSVAAAKHLVSEEAREIAKHAVQLHGAIGVTDELDISHYFRRIAVLAGAYGDVDHHLDRFTAMMTSKVAA